MHILEYIPTLYMHAIKVSTSYCTYRPKNASGRLGTVEAKRWGSSSRWNIVLQHEAGPISSSSCRRCISRTDVRLGDASVCAPGAVLGFIAVFRVYRGSISTNKVRRSTEKGENL